MEDIMFALLFGAVSLLYATVGQAGGTAFLALMAFASFPSNEMRPTGAAAQYCCRIILDLAVQSWKLGGLGKAHASLTCLAPHGSGRWLHRPR
jgi:hypothetical protein